jgi:hypothetical protein
MDEFLNVVIEMCVSTCTVADESIDALFEALLVQHGWLK